MQKVDCATEPSHAAHNLLACELVQHGHKREHGFAYEKASIDLHLFVRVQVLDDIRMAKSLYQLSKKNQEFHKPKSFGDHFTQDYFYMIRGVSMFGPGRVFMFEFKKSAIFHVVISASVDCPECCFIRSVFSVDCVGQIGRLDDPHVWLEKKNIKKKKRRISYDDIDQK
jgi:hypothetical protein